MDEKITRREFDSLRAEIDDLRRGQQRQPSALITVVGTFAVLLAGTAIAQPSLSSFSANTPARASEVNANFDLVQDWIEEKVGAVNSTDVDITGTTTTNAITVNGAGTFNAGAEVTSGGLNVTGSSVFQNGVAFNDLATANNGIYVASGNLSVAAGSVWVQNDTQIEGGITDSCSGAATDASGCVTDTDAGASPHGRVNSDSFHTNGLGDGQMWIEGYYIDANNTIQIGRGMAGGQDVEDVAMGADLYLDGDIRTNGATGADCAWQGCVDAPSSATCPAARPFLRGIQIPDMAGSEERVSECTGGNADDYRIYCCAGT